MKIRNLIAATIVFVLLAIAWAIANAYTTDSEISPQELGKWQIVRRTAADTQGFFYIIAENPELRLDSIDCPIKYVLLCVDSRKDAMVAYAYYRDDVLMVFEIVWENREHKDGHFQRIYQIVPEAKRLIDWFLMPFLKKFKKSSVIEET